MVKIEIFFYFGNWECSGMVGYCYLVIGNWVSDGNIVVFYFDFMFFKINVNDCFEVGVIKFWIGFSLWDFIIGNII